MKVAVLGPFLLYFYRFLQCLCTRPCSLTSRGFYICLQTCSLQPAIPNHATLRYSLPEMEDRCAVSYVDGWCFKLETSSAMNTWQSLLITKSIYQKGAWTGQNGRNTRSRAELPTTDHLKPWTGRQSHECTPAFGELYSHHEAVPWIVWRVLEAARFVYLLLAMENNVYCLLFSNFQHFWRIVKLKTMFKGFHTHTHWTLLSSCSSCGGSMWRTEKFLIL